MNISKPLLKQIDNMIVTFIGGEIINSLDSKEEKLKKNLEMHNTRTNAEKYQGLLIFTGTSLNNSVNDMRRYGKTLIDNYIKTM